MVPELIAFLLWYIFLVLCCVVPTCCAYRRRRIVERRMAQQQENFARMQESNFFFLSSLATTAAITQNRRGGADGEAVQAERARHLTETLKETTMVRMRVGNAVVLCFLFRISTACCFSSASYIDGQRGEYRITGSIRTNCGVTWSSCIHA